MIEGINQSLIIRMLDGMIKKAIASCRTCKDTNQGNVNQDISGSTAQKLTFNFTIQRDEVNDIVYILNDELNAICDGVSRINLNQYLYTYGILKEIRNDDSNRSIQMPLCADGYDGSESGSPLYVYQVANAPLNTMGGLTNVFQILYSSQNGIPSRSMTLYGEELTAIDSLPDGQFYNTNYILTLYYEPM
jgi:hypothetical protein